VQFLPSIPYYVFFLPLGASFLLETHLNTLSHLQGPLYIASKFCKFF